MKKIRIYHLLISLLSICIIAAFVLLFTIKKNEPFTELFFDMHQILPQEVELYRRYTFDFTIHNYEYQRKSYIYAIYVSSYAIHFGEVTLDHDQSITLKRSFMINQYVEHAKITVRLENKCQEIFFWVKVK